MKVLIDGHGMDDKKKLIMLIAVGPPRLGSPQRAAVQGQDL